MIKEKIMRAGKTLHADIVITEIGGTVGDIESQPFLEAIRQMKAEVGDENVVYIHTTLIPYLRAAGEMKTKPTQHSVRELRGLGIQPNILVVRTEKPITEAMRAKIALFCDVKPEAVVESMDVDTIYEVPLRLQKQGMDQLVLDHLHVQAPVSDMADWSTMINKINHLQKTITIALVGKYVALQDAYISAEAWNTRAIHWCEDWSAPDRCWKSDAGNGGHLKGCRWTTGSGGFGDVSKAWHGDSRPWK